MSTITTHVLDTSVGKPAAGIPVALERKTHTAGWQTVSEGITDIDGRVGNMLPPGEVFLPGHYRLTFETGPYFSLMDLNCFFPLVTISFVVRDIHEHHHVPLLISPFGYSTYRGS